MPLEFDDYDTRGYRTLGVRDGYRAWSKTYDATVVDELDLDLLASLESVPWEAVARAADLACGTGRIGRWLKAKGVAHIDGVDVTQEMLALARTRALYERLHCEDMRQTSLVNASYDLAINVLSCEHVPELGPLYAEAARIVRDQGWFVLIGYHPHFLLNGIPTHFKDTAGGNTAIRNTIHLLSDHVSAARANGWWLLELRERIVDAGMVSRLPTWQRHQGRPVSFVCVWHQGTPTASDR